MLLPTSYTAAGPATSIVHNGPSPSPTSAIPGVGSEGWSSLIGIVTAIIGNILISFALNMQRYAHIRLTRDWEEEEKSRKERSRSSGGAGQAKMAEERAKANLSHEFHPPRHVNYTVENEREDLDEGAVATEADPLIPSIASRTGHGRSKSRGVRHSLDSTASASTNGEAALKQKSYLRSPYWWAGIIMMIVGEAGNFLAYGFAPASIVSPLGVVALISNCIIAPILLKERFRKRDGFGVLVAVAGAVTVVASASDNNPKLGPDEIWDLIATWEFETYFGITVAVIIALAVASNRFGHKSVLIDLGLVGLFGGYTALSTKGVASLLTYTIVRALTFPVTYLLALILIFTAVMQIKYVNRALQRFDATQVIPTQFVLFTLSVILGSAVLYRDFEKTSGDDAGKFVGGCAMTFLGVWLITSGRPRGSENEEDDREPEPPEAINLVDGEQYRDSVDGAGASSRRSSTLRATSPPIPIHRRESRGHSPSPPATPTITFTPQDEAQSPLAANPWISSISSVSPSPSPATRQPPPPLSKISTHSMPVLPSTSSPDPPSTSTQNQLSPPELGDRPRTPMRGVSDNALPASITTPITPLNERNQGTARETPRFSRQATAERLAARNSIAGPVLTSPLSNSLSAMVADLKRGSSFRGSREDVSGRRRESLLGLGDDTEGAASVSRTVSRESVEEVQEDGAKSRVRGRSLSGTVKGLWRGLKAKSGENVNGDGGDEEQGRR